MLIYETSSDVEQDVQNIVEYTLENHGPNQVKKYISKLEECARNLAKNKAVFRKIRINEITVRVMHCQHHFIFGYERLNAPFLVIAVFHERMDLMKRLKNRLP